MFIAYLPKILCVEQPQNHLLVQKQIHLVLFSFKLIAVRLQILKPIALYTLQNI